MTSNPTACLSRRGLLRAGLGLACSVAASSAVAAPSILRGAGDIRLINLSNQRTGERLNAIYWVEGSYIPEVLAEVDHIMRDWRLDLTKRIAPDVVDIISAVHARLDTSEPFVIYSGYRSPQTNRMLRAKYRGVARSSYHIKGMAADLHMENRSVRQIASAGLDLGAGGVGKYSRSNFVHLDCGPVRHWGR